jgi:hypothetical protein
MVAATDVPVQYFQSVITIELAVAGALLWQMRYFEPRGGHGTAPVYLTRGCDSGWRLCWV